MTRDKVEEIMAQTKQKQMSNSPPIINRDDVIGVVLTRRLSRMEVVRIVEQASAIVKRAIVNLRRLFKIIPKQPDPQVRQLRDPIAANAIRGRWPLMDKRIAAALGVYDDDGPWAQWAKAWLKGRLRTDAAWEATLRAMEALETHARRSGRWAEVTSKLAAEDAHPRDVRANVVFGQADAALAAALEATTAAMAYAWARELLANAACWDKMAVPVV